MENVTRFDIFDVMILELPKAEDIEAMPKFLLKPTTVIAADRASAVAVAMIQGNVMKKIEKRAAKAKNGKYETSRIRPLVRSFYEKPGYTPLSVSSSAKKAPAKKKVTKKAPAKKAVANKKEVAKKESTSEKDVV